MCQSLVAVPPPAAAATQRTASDAERGTQHRRCLQLLLDAGCRVDGKDAAGWTALHHATGAAAAARGFHV